MINKNIHNFINDKTIIKELEIHLRKKIDNDVAYKIKEYTKGYPDYENERIVDENIKIDPFYAARTFVKLMGSKIVYTGKSIYIYDKGVWKKCEKIDLQIKIGNDFYKQLQLIQYKNSRKRFYDYSGDYKKMTSLIRALPSQCYKQEKFFTHQKIQTGFGKLLFNDCMYDMDKRVFRDFDQNITLFARINRCRPIRDKKMIDKVHKIIFEDPYIDLDVGLRLKQEIALGIHGGYYTQKKFVPCVGNSNTGKSVTVDFIMYTFKDYVGIFNTHIFASSKSSSNSNKELKWLEPISMNRINISSSYDVHKKLSSRIFSTALNGNEEIKLNKKSDTFINYSRLMTFTNDSIKFLDYNNNVKDRIDGEIKLEVKFESVPNPDNPSRSKLKIDKLREKIWTDKEYLDAFFWIIMDTYADLMNNEYKLIIPSYFSS